MQLQGIMLDHYFVLLKHLSNQCLLKQTVSNAVINQLVRSKELCPFNRDKGTQHVFENLISFLISSSNTQAAGPNFQDGYNGSSFVLASPRAPVCQFVKLINGRQTCAEHKGFPSDSNNLNRYFSSANMPLKVGYSTN